MTNRPFFYFLAALAFSGGSSAALAGQSVYVKSEAVRASQMDADLQGCVQEVLAYMNGPQSPVPPLKNPTPDQLLIRSFDMRGPKAAAAAEARCMGDKGYVALVLTSEESKALSRSKGVTARDQWYDAFVMGDLRTRIAEVRTASPINTR